GRGSGAGDRLRMADAGPRDDLGVAGGAVAAAPDFGPDRRRPAGRTRADDADFRAGGPVARLDAGDSAARRLRRPRRKLARGGGAGRPSQSLATAAADSLAGAVGVVLRHALDGRDRPRRALRLAPPAAGRPAAPADRFRRPGIRDADDRPGHAAGPAPRARRGDREVPLLARFDGACPLWWTQGVRAPEGGPR